MSRYLRWSHYVEFRTGSPATDPDFYNWDTLLSKPEPKWSWKFRGFKTLFDYGSAILVLPVVAVLACVLLVLNPWLNPGPVFFVQSRAGQFRKEFRMWKFRTMLSSDVAARDPNAKLEEHRITRLGRIMRKTRIDELPNFINVLRGEMSVIGPRPDAASHASYYSETVHGYAERHRVKPGITGLAQVEQGYAEDEDETSLKAKYDNMYVARSCGRLDLYIIWRTFAVMVRGLGAK